MKYLSIENVLKGLIVKFESEVEHFTKKMIVENGHARDEELPKSERDEWNEESCISLGRKYEAMAAINIIQKTLSDLQGGVK